MNLPQPAPKGVKWKERFSDFAKYAVMTSRGFLMENGAIKEFNTSAEASVYLSKGGQIIPLPIAISRGKRK